MKHSSFFDRRFDFLRARALFLLRTFLGEWRTTAVLKGERACSRHHPRWLESFLCHCTRLTRDRAFRCRGGTNTTVVILDDTGAVLSEARGSGSNGYVRIPTADEVAMPQ